MKFSLRLVFGVSLSATMATLCMTQQTSALPTTQKPSPSVELHTFFSEALHRTMPYEVVLPAGYGASGQRYPVLYLLHGWHGDETNYIQLTSLLITISAYPLIVVMPRGDDSWYVNASTVTGDRYGDYLFKDVVQETDKKFRTIASLQGRAIAGLSMGGYGAMLVSLQHPNAFRFVGSLSGAFAGPTGIEHIMPALKPSTDAAFGGINSAARHKNDLDPLLASDDPAGQPYLYLACGSADPLLPANRHVVEELSARKFAYEYHEMPGAHTWTFWSAQLEPMLAVLAREMHITPLTKDSKPASAATVQIP
jgi:putative tributyrin esterase